MLTRLREWFRRVVRSMFGGGGIVRYINLFCCKFKRKPPTLPIVGG